MTETPKDEAPEPEKTSPPPEPGESPYEPFETQDFYGSDDSVRNRLDLSNERHRRRPSERNE